jgi:hypothetical protein
VLLPILERNKYFQERNLDSAALLRVIQGIKYQVCKADQYVFSYGDIGEHFFLILNGVV